MKKICFAVALALGVSSLSLSYAAEENAADPYTCALAEGGYDKSCVEQSVAYWEGQIKTSYLHNKQACDNIYADNEEKLQKCHKDLSESLRLWRDFRKKMLVVYRQTNCQTPEQNVNLPFYFMVIQLTKAQVEVFNKADLHVPEAQK